MLVFGENEFAKFFLQSKIFIKNENLPNPLKTHPDMNLCIIDNTVFLPHIMSRKKQIIPMLSTLWG